jgi:hypothetical protein
MATWAPPGTTDGIDFGQTVQIMDPLTGGITNAGTYSLTNAPVLVVGVPSSLVAQAQADQGLPFPWGGDYTGAASVSVAMGAPNTEAGLHQLNPDGTSTAVFVYGGPARDCSRSSAQVFTVDPNFLSYTPTPIQITAVLRRIGPDTAGFNLKYESRTGWRTAGGWYTVPGYGQWYTHTWTITDDEFVSKWGYNFRFDSDSTTFSRYYLQSVTVTIGAAPAPMRSPPAAAPPQPRAADGQEILTTAGIDHPPGGTYLDVSSVSLEPERSCWSLPPITNRAVNRQVPPLDRLFGRRPHTTKVALPAFAPDGTGLASREYDAPDLAVLDLKALRRQLAEKGSGRRVQR